MDPQAVTAFLSYLKDQRLLVDYFYVASVAVLIYDYILTLHLEVKLIWFSPWNRSKVLFLLTRYIPIINIYFMLHYQVLYGSTVQSCYWSFSIAAWLLIFGVFIAETVLMLRTWAVWSLDKKIGVAFCIMMIVTVVVGCVFEARFLKSVKVAPPLYPQFRGCFGTQGTRIFFYTYIVLAVDGSVVLTLMLISAYHSYRSGNSSELSKVVHRDGIMFYVYILCLTIANVVAIIVCPIAFVTLLCSFQAVMYCIFTSRIVLNVRETARKTSFESTTYLHDIPLSALLVRPPSNFPSICDTMETLHD